MDEPAGNAHIEARCDMDMTCTRDTCGRENFLRRVAGAGVIIGRTFELEFSLRI